MTVRNEESLLLRSADEVLLLDTSSSGEELQDLLDLSSMIKSFLSVSSVPSLS